MKLANHRSITFSKMRNGLSRRLVTWFLLLSLVPLCLLSWLSYQQAQQVLTKEAVTRLQQSASLKIEFINNWFDYRVMDLTFQAGLGNNAKLLTSLTEGLAASNLSVSEYVKSDDWGKRIDGLQNDLITLSRRYDYIYDIFLIDSSGHIVYSIAREPDLGTDLLLGKYSDSQFSQTVKNTLETGKVNFSGIERYAPSNDAIAGFISAPLLYESGEKQGAIAFQIRIERIFKILQVQQSTNTTMSHYLVNGQGLLLSPLHTNWNEVLNRVIDTVHIGSSQATEIKKIQTHKYNGPENINVIGTRNNFSLLNHNWVLISEIETEEAQVTANWLAKVTIALLLLTACMVVFLAVFLTRRITQPIIALSIAAGKVAAGERDQQVEITSQDEIGILAQAFNHMLTNRQNYEHALERSNREISQALKDLQEQQYALDQHAIVAITDIQGTITFVNKRFTDISGYSHDELLGRNHRMLNSGYHDTDFFKFLYQTITKGDVWHGEICNLAKDGHLYWVDTTIVPIKDDKGKAKSYIAIRTDITDRKQNELALIVAKESAEVATRAKSEFLASMSHEIRTPMNGILGMLGLLLNTDLDSNQYHNAIVAQTSAQSLLTLINDILDLSKIDADKLELESLNFDLRTMLGDFADAMAMQAQEKGLELILDITGIDQSMVKGDPGRLRQILTNLVGNAIKFTENGEIIIRVNLKSEDDNNWQFSGSVIDTGIGIPKAKLPQLFDSFTQADSSTTRKFGGTGLGLSIARKFCLLMNGDITVTSEPGKGSCFEVRVRLQKCVQSIAVIPKVDISTLHLLIVDDNKTNRDVLRGQLEHWGASVFEAKSAKQAIAVCDKRDSNSELPFFDIAFIDMQMPNKDGAELGKKLKTDPRFHSMKLVMMTSMGHQGDAHFFADLGFSAYFPKPATTSDLFDALAVITENGDALKQAQPLVTRHYLKTLDRHQTKVSRQHNLQKISDKTRILLVEDNLVNQQVAVGILAQFNLSVDIAENGLEALASLQKATGDSSAYSLVLMDCQMPQMDGYEASRAIRSGVAGNNNKDIPIIAMTANAMQGDLEKCLDAGMIDYITKPVDTDIFLSKLNQWLPPVLKSNISFLNSRAEVNHQSGAANSDIDQLSTIWDKASLLKRILHKEELLTSLLDIFLLETPEQLKKLRAAVNGKDSEQIQSLAHTIKGAAGNISGLRFEQKAKQLEKSIKTGEGKHIKTLMTALELAFEELSDCIREHLINTGEKVVSDKSVLSVEMLTEHLHSILDRLKQNDYIDPQELKILRHASKDNGIQDRLKILIGTIEQFENSKAIDIIHEITYASNQSL